MMTGLNDDWYIYIICMYSIRVNCKSDQFTIL